MSDARTTPGVAEYVTLSLATADDIPDLVRVHNAAFKADLFSHLMLLNKPEDARDKLLSGCMEKWVVDPDTQVVKAVQDGQLVGWSCWVVKRKADGDKSESTVKTGKQVNDDPSTSVPAPVVPPAATEAGQQETSDPPTHEIPQSTTTQDPPVPEDRTRTLGSLMRADNVKAEQKFLSGVRKYLELQGLAVLPSHQGKGIGLKLVEWGTRRADVEGYGIWAHASPASHGLYRRCGFQEVGSWGADLAEYAPGGKGGERGWGRYVFRYMLRARRRGWDGEGESGETKTGETGETETENS